MNPTLPPKEWPLQQLADKMKQYCYLLSDLEPELLAQEAKGDYETLRDYLRERGVEAYWQKVLTALNPLGSILAVRIQKACRESGSTSEMLILQWQKKYGSAPEAGCPGIGCNQALTMHCHC